MQYEEFLRSIEQDQKPADTLSTALKALWYDAKGDWQAAHTLIDHLEDDKSSRVHAYLHRVEGDVWNARYWYGKAKSKEFHGELKDEWLYLVKLYL
ncbi:hypothetical protein [Sphingobacterium sp. JB170]|uniref:hypothetical protein n=1 Tax=Sphingobacterium sp. JB170 TaxID=1434842 RepID=UPI00097EA74A|nr:hypothetical protein [Sphingobacterium sp. JB170]SJN40361.1 Bll5088 protein [Sphingobacterium sp. JB170]